jgi:hypothetical protein
MKLSARIALNDPSRGDLKGGGHVTEGFYRNDAEMWVFLRVRTRVPSDASASPQSSPPAGRAQGRRTGVCEGQQDEAEGKQRDQLQCVYAEKVADPQVSALSVPAGGRCKRLVRAGRTARLGRQRRHASIVGAAVRRYRSGSSPAEVGMDLPWLSPD